jgi:hypothetical protein
MNQHIAHSLGPTGTTSGQVDTADQLAPKDKAAIAAFGRQHGVRFDLGSPLQNTYHVARLENVKRTAATDPVEYTLSARLDLYAFIHRVTVRARGVVLSSFSGAALVPDTTYGVDHVDLRDFIELRWARQNRSITVGAGGGYVMASEFEQFLTQSRLGMSEALMSGETLGLDARIAPCVAQLDLLTVTFHALVLTPSSVG